MFSEGNVLIRPAKIENGQNWHPIHLVIKQVIMRSLKKYWNKKTGTVFKETQRGIWFSFLPISSNFNWCLYWNMWVMQEFHQIKMILDGKVLWYLEKVSPFDKDNSSVGSIATSIIANEVEKMKGKDIFKYSFPAKRKFLIK